MNPKLLLELVSMAETFLSVSGPSQALKHKNRKKEKFSNVACSPLSLFHIQML
jgi:hypothetical protein